MHGQDEAFFSPPVALIWDSLEPWMWLNPEDGGLIVFFLSAPANSFGVQEVTKYSGQGSGLNLVLLNICSLTLCEPVWAWFPGP